MNHSTRIHSAGDSGQVEFRASTGQRRPVLKPQPVEVVVIGHTGQVGSALMSKLHRLVAGANQPPLRLAEGINRRSHLLVGQRGTRELRKDAGTLGGLADRLLVRGRPAVIVDCSADPDLPRHYPAWLKAGIGVVTPNKHGFAGDRSLNAAIIRSARLGRAPLGYSATVGAGLPILSTLRRLRQAGIRPAGLTAVVSGTLTHVFGQMALGKSLSQSVADAARRGFAEPNPLEDLSGLDVERKLTIMLREAGLGDVAIVREPVIETDAGSVDGDVDAILRGHDERWRHRLSEARSAGRVWTYLAQFGDGGARCAPAMVESDSAFARLEGSANLVRIDPEGEGLGPILVHGPGAGVETTAGAVMADLAEAAAHLQAQR